MANPSAGGSFNPTTDYDFTGTVTFNGVSPVTTSGSQTLTGKTLTAPVVNGAVTGTTFRDRVQKCAVTALSGATIHAGTVAWQNPESAAIQIQRVTLDITTASTGASTLDIGYTATNATTSSDTFLDGVSGTPAALFDSMNAALDSGANAKAQNGASGKWVTVTEASGDATGLVGNLYVFYILT